jgi:hypothetical protein
MNPQTPPVIPSQTPIVTKESKKRKRRLDLDSITKVFDVEPEDYEAAWKALRARITEVNTPGLVATVGLCSYCAPQAIGLRFQLAPTSLGFLEALQLFNLRQASTNLWADVQVLPVPQYLEDNLARIHSVTHSSIHDNNNEAFSRTILDHILICSMYEEGNRSDRLLKQDKDERPSYPPHSHPSILNTSTKEDPAKLELQHETPLSRRVSHNGETKLLTGFADYTIWYDSAKKNTLATNLLIVEAKRRFQTDAALPQLVAYMGLIHTQRKEESKQNCVVYGASSDGLDFRFCRIDNDGVFVKSKLLEWKAGDRDKIYSIIRSLVRAAALSSPSTTPIKDPMQRELVLASFGSPQHSKKFDYGLSGLQILEEDEEDDEEGEIINWDE